MAVPTVPAPTIDTLAAWGPPRRAMADSVTTPSWLAGWNTRHVGRIEHDARSLQTHREPGEYSASSEAHPARRPAAPCLAATIPARHLLGRRDIGAHDPRPQDGPAALHAAVLRPPRWSPLHRRILRRPRRAAQLVLEPDC